MSRRTLGCVPLLLLASVLTSCGGGSDVPDISYCESVSEWSDSATELEEEILDIVNQRRSEGANCGAQGSFDSAPPLSMNVNLRCAARKHTADMVDKDYFSHNAPDGTGPQARIDAAEYNWMTWGENIAGGNADAASTMDQWMNSDGHCANIMNPNFTEIGVGYMAGGEFSHTWTQVFGAPQ